MQGWNVYTEKNNFKLQINKACTERFLLGAGFCGLMEKFNFEEIVCVIEVSELCLHLENLICYYVTSTHVEAVALIEKK